MRYLMTFSYDGTNYNGYQKQPNKNTVQDKIEQALFKITNTNITIHSSGRTDSKVHALNQKAHFDLDKEMDLYKLKKGINSLIPDDIYIKDIVEVKDDFHARFNVKKKIYIYKLNVGIYNPIDRNYIYQYNKNLDVNSMIEASKYLLGEHNFKAFTKTDISKDDYIRTIYDIKIKEKDNIITLEFIGNKLKTEDICHILKSEDRKNAYKTANPEGLYLKDVKY